MLSNRLRVILNNNNPNFLVAIPDVSIIMIILKILIQTGGNYICVKIAYNLYKLISLIMSIIILI